MNIMETALFDAIIKVGSTGLVAGVLWIIAKRFMDETVKQMSSRIDALEKRSDSCEEDRKQLHTRIFNLLSKTENLHHDHP